MAIRSADDESTARNVWRELASRQGEAFESYGRALKSYGEGNLPAEALAREAADLAARGTADAVRISLELAQDLYRWAWCLIGVRMEPGGGQSPDEPVASAPGAESS